MGEGGYKGMGTGIKGMGWGLWESDHLKRAGIQIVNQIDHNIYEY